MHFCAFLVHMRTRLRSASVRIICVSIPAGAWTMQTENSELRVRRTWMLTGMSLPSDRYSPVLASICPISPMTSKPLTTFLVQQIVLGQKICMYVCMYVYIYVRICPYTYMHAYTCIVVYARTDMCVRIINRYVKMLMSVAWSLVCQKVHRCVCV